MSQEAAEVTHKGVLSVQVCVPYHWTDGMIVKYAEEEFPCGTTNGWQIRREGTKDLAGFPERNPCATRPGFVHVMLDA